MSNHLQFTKWRDSAFSTEQLKSTRWLLNSKPKNMPEALQEPLTVTATAQQMLMELHVRSFTNASRRMKATSRSKARLSAEEFEKLVDFSCIFARLRDSAKMLKFDKSVDDKLMEAFLNKCPIETVVHNDGCCWLVGCCSCCGCPDCSSNFQMLSGTTLLTSRRWWLLAILRFGWLL